jgi:putative ABC transport system permease protein
MRLSSILRLYRVRLRARLAQELFAVLGIAIGVSLLFASQVANTSLDGSVQRLTTGIVGTMRFELSSRDDHGFSEKLAGEVARIPGVEVAAPVLEQDANVVGPKGAQSVDLVGTDPGLAHLGGNIARHLGSVPLNGARVFTLPAPIAERIGVYSARNVELQVGADAARALLVPQLLGSGGGTLGDSPIALAPLRSAQQLSGREGRLTSIYVRSPARLDRSVRAALVRLAAGRLNVTRADVTSALFRRAAGPVDQSTGLFSALSALVGFLFAFNALLLTVTQRRNLIQDLRLDGYTRKMVVQVLMLDALALGVVASVLGLALGEVLSIALFRSSPGYLTFAFPVGGQRIVQWSSVGLAVAGGMLAAATGVLAPLRGELFERPTRSPQPPARTRPRSGWLLVIAIPLILATTGILLAAPQDAIIGVVSLTLALLLCLPGLLDLAIEACGGMQRLLTGAASYLALIELRSRGNRTRSLAIAATGAIAVFGSVSIQGARSGLQRGLDASAKGIDSQADIWITPGASSDSFATTSFTDSVGKGLARLPGVRSVHLYRGSFLDWGDRRIWVVAPPRSAAHPVATSQLESGSPALVRSRLRARGWVVISRAIAAEHGLRVGATFTLPTSHPMRFQIAALGTNLGWSPGAVIMNADDYARAWGSPDPSAYQLDLAADADLTEVARAAKLVLGQSTALRVESAQQRERRHYSQAAQGLSRLTQIRSLVLIAAVLAMAAAMGAMIWQRRARLADMKVDGFGRGVLWRALLWESSILLGAGCVLGAIFGLFGQLLLSRALSNVYGFPVIEAFSISAAVASCALIVVVAVLIVAIPGYAAARVRASVGMPE